MTKTFDRLHRGKDRTDPTGQLFRAGRVACLVGMATVASAQNPGLPARSFTNPWGQTVRDLVISPVQAGLTFNWNSNKGDYHRITFKAPTGVQHRITGLEFDVQTAPVDTDIVLFEWPLQGPDVTYHIWEQLGYVGFDSANAFIHGTERLRIVATGGNLALKDPSNESQSFPACQSQSNVCPGHALAVAPAGFDPDQPGSFPFGMVFGYVPVYGDPNRYQACGVSYPFDTDGSNPSYQITNRSLLVRTGFVLGLHRPDLNLSLYNCLRDHVDHYFLKFEIVLSGGVQVVRAMLTRFTATPYYSGSFSVGDLSTTFPHVSGDTIPAPSTLVRYQASAAVVSALNTKRNSLVDTDGDGFVDVPLYVAAYPTDGLAGREEVGAGLRISNLVVQFTPYGGDLNGDGCIDRTDLTMLINGIQSGTASSSWDLNSDGSVDVADARKLATMFNEPLGRPCY